METILQQIYSELVKNSLNTINELGVSDLDRLSRELLEHCKLSVNDIISGLAKEIDTAFINDKSHRKKDGISIQERDMDRTIYLPTGELTFQRTYFEKKNDKDVGHLYPVDILLGIDAYERMSKGIAADLIQNAAEYSYAKSSINVSDGKFSRQTVRNKVLDVGELAYLPEKRENTPNELHIFADEDHVHLQDKNSKKKKGTMVRLITSSEGTDEVSKGRNRLKFPIHFEGYSIKPEKHWEYVYAVLASVYEMEKVKRIFIHGDGASWIDSAAIAFPEAIHMIDQYHLHKYIKAMTAENELKKYKNRIWWALEDNSINKLDHVLADILKELENIYAHDEKKRMSKQDSILKAAAYLANNIEKIHNRLKYNTVGSCTEPLISHILSKRLSRDPMGWSKNGLSKVAMIRVYVKNGGKVIAVDVDKDKKKSDKERQIISCIKKYEKLADKLIEDVVKDSSKWRWLEKESYSNGKTTGTTVLLRSAGEMKNVC